MANAFEDFAWKIGDKLGKSKFSKKVNEMADSEAPDWLTNTGDKVYNAGRKFKNALVGEEQVAETKLQKIKRLAALKKKKEAALMVADGE
jgi:hypothetical protein